MVETDRSIKRKQSDFSTREEVAERDKGRCVICFMVADDIHEIIPRSALSHKYNDILFSVKNRVCLCRKHHNTAHTHEMRTFLISLLQKRFGYVYQEEVFQNYLLKEES